MQKINLYSKAFTNNIERTFTFAHARNAHQYKGEVSDYNPVAFFDRLVKIDPFATVMELDNHNFKNAKKALDRYNIPYTIEQERRARIFHDTVTRMVEERSDYVRIPYSEKDVENTGVVILDGNNLATTKQTQAVNQFIRSLPYSKTLQNRFYDDLVSPLIKQSREQLDALKTSVMSQISCVIGGAGTGKSFVTAAIIEQLYANGLKVIILAPTHKAKEALQTKLKRGTVRTVHSYIHKPSEDADVLVIDEAGMLSTNLMYGLINVYRDEQLIFVGDKNQLPPIEYGRPFELIQELANVSKLIGNKRSESKDIIALGREIIGEPFNANTPVENIIQVDTIEQAFKLGAEVLLTYTNADRKYTNETQRIKYGNPSISPQFMIGEEIIAKTNDPDRFYNGQLFRVVDYNKIKEKQTGRIVEIVHRKDLEYNFDLAYGLTIHKSQGSEWDVVAYKPTEKDTRNLSYVAVTRARKKLIIVGAFPEQYATEREWKQL